MYSTFIFGKGDVCAFLDKLLVHIHVGRLDGVHEWGGPSITLQVDVSLGEASAGAIPFSMRLTFTVHLACEW